MCLVQRVWGSGGRGGGEAGHSGPYSSLQLRSLVGRQSSGTKQVSVVEVLSHHHGVYKKRNAILLKLYCRPVNQSCHLLRLLSPSECMLLSSGVTVAPLQDVTPTPKATAALKTTIRSSCRTEEMRCRPLEKSFLIVQRSRAVLH